MTQEGTPPTPDQQATELQSLLSRLAESEDRFQKMADSAPVLLWMSREDSLCVFFNQTWLDFSGKTLEQEWGVGWAEGIHPADFQKSMDTYVTSFNQRQPFEMIYRLLRHDRQYRWILDRGIPRYDSGGVFLGYVGSCVDITEQVEAQEELKLRNRKLEELNREIEQFSHLAAHDLREPANRIALIANLFVNDYGHLLPEESKTFLLGLENEASSMLRLIGGFRYLTQLDVRSKLPCDLIQIEPILEHVLKDRYPELAKKNAQVALQKIAPARIQEELCYSLFNNLVLNAVQHGDPGMELMITCEQSDAKTVPVYGVKNTCSQLDLGRLKSQLFIPFRKVNKSSENTGLGLYICRKIVEAHGGRIWIENIEQFFSIRFTLAGSP